MSTQAPNFSGPDILGGSDFNLADHKGSFVLILLNHKIFSVVWDAYEKHSVLSMQLLANQFAADPSFPVVEFVVLVDPNQGNTIDEIAAWPKEENITIPIIAVSYDLINEYAMAAYGELISEHWCCVVKPSGELCDTPAVGPYGHYYSTDLLQGLLLKCGAPLPGHPLVADWESRLLGPLVVNLAFTGTGPPKDFPVPVDSGPGPVPKRLIGLDVLSREVVRALAIHDAASRLPYHEARTAVRLQALKAAAASLRRMESLAALESELGPPRKLPPRQRQQESDRGI